MSKPKFYLPGLDALRTIAAFSVVIGHIELFKKNNGIQNLFNHMYFKYTSGHTGVTLFFVLSGFIITLLLLKEQKKYNNISLKHFYFRRMLRVWPLYFLVLLISIILFGYRPPFLTIALCISIFPNIAHALDMGWLLNPPVWSIGVEEQFYLFHPILVKLLKKYLIYFLIIFFFSYTILPEFILCYLRRNCNHPMWEIYINNFFYLSKFNVMAVGGIVACLHNSYSDKIKQLFRFKFISALLFILPFLLWFSGYYLYWDVGRFCMLTLNLTEELYAIMFGMVILIVTNSSFVSSLLDQKPLNYLGKISYGIYMYHWFVLTLLMKIAIPIFNYNYLLGNLFFYSASILISVGIAALSFKYFENIFLRFRNKFSKV